MILCLDVGNTQLHGGIFVDGEIRFQFRKTSKTQSSSDEFGLFLKSVIRENGFDPNAISAIAICSVVPEVIHSLTGACEKYFDIRPFLLQAGAKTGLKIKYRNPQEVGADRIANSVAATDIFPNRNLIIVDFGTATTFCAINKDREYLGGAIVSGMKISMEALEARTSKLPSVQILKPQEVVGRSTVESIQSGLYFGTIGIVRELCSRITSEQFKEIPPLIIGTGGFCSLLKDEGLFDHIDPYLALKGMHLAYLKNS